MATVIAATKARNNFFDILDLAMYEGKEFIIEKDGKPVAKVSPIVPKRDPKEIDRILTRVRKAFASSKRRKYWGVMDTPAWKRKERRYLERLSKGIID